MKLKIHPLEQLDPKFAGLTPGQCLHRFKSDFINVTTLRNRGWPEKWIVKLGTPDATRLNEYHQECRFWHKSRLSKFDNLPDFKSNVRKKDIRGKAVAEGLAKAVDAIHQKRLALVAGMELVIPKVRIDSLIKRAAKEVIPYMACMGRKPDRTDILNQAFWTLLRKSNYSDTCLKIKGRRFFSECKELLCKRWRETVYGKYPKLRLPEGKWCGDRTPEWTGCSLQRFN